jgi:tape measure domain-containing protein
MALDITTLSVKVQAQGINDTAKALDNLALSAEKAEKSADRLGEKFSKSSTGILAIKTAMEGMKDMMSKAFPTDGAQALNKALGELSATLKTIKGKKIDIDVGGVGRDAEVARKGVESLNRSLMEGHNVFQVVGKSLYQLRNMLGGTMLFAALQNTTGAVITLADTWTLANARLKIFMGSADAAVVAQERLYNVSMDLKVPLQGVTTLFTRLVPAMAEYGYSADSAMKVTTSMAAALKVSGATAAETSSVLLQFSQSMAAGRLNGAEFNAVAEGAPIVLRLLSKELGVSRAELKKMAADGLLSTATVADVLIDSLDELKNKAKDMPLTVSAALDMLSASFAKLFGEMNKGGGVTGVISASIELLAKNLSSILNILGMVATAFVTYNALLVAYNIIVATSSTLSTSLAASLGITAAASGAAAGAVGLLNGALKFLMTNPVILSLTAIVTALFYFRDELFGTKDAAEKAGVAIQEALSKGDYQAAITAQQAEVARLSNEYNNLSGELVRLQKEQAKAKELGFATSSQEKVIQDLTVQVEKLKKQWEGAKDNLKEYNRELEGDKIKKATNAIDEYITKMQHEIGLKRKMSQADEMLWKAEKARSALGTDANIKRVREAEENINKAKQAIEVEKQHKEATTDRVKAIKESESALKRAMNAYARSVSSSEESIEKLKEELALKRNLTEAEKQVIKFRKDAEEFTKKTGRKSTELDENIKIIEQLGARKKFEDDLNKALDRKQARDLQVAETEAELANSIFMTNEAISKKIELVKRANAEIPTTPLQEQMDETTRIQERIGFLEAQIKITEELATTTAYLAYWSAYATGDEKAMERAEKAQDNIQKRIDGYNKEIATLKNVLDVSKDLAEQEFIRSKIRMQEIGRSPAQILADGFGEAGKAIGGMVDAYDDFGKQAKQINAELQAQLEYMAKKGVSPEVIAKAEQAAAEKRVQINTQMYGNMASSAKGFFKQQTTEYKTLERVEKAFRALEMVMAIKSMVTQVMGIETVAAAETASVPTVVGAQQIKGNAAAATGVANQSAGDPYTAIPRMAAMVAIMAALGFVVSNINGGVVDPTEERQANQGTGTVLGDVTAKSESITNAIELIEENTSVSAKYNEGMLLALKNIETALGGAAKTITRSKIGTGVDVNSYGGIDLGSMSQNSYMGKVTTNFIDKLADIDASLKKYLLPMLGGDALKKIFGVKVSVKDTGIFAQPQTVSDILEKGFSGASFTTVEKKARFRKAKQEDVFGELPEAAEKQFELVIKSLSSGLQEVGGVLDVNGEDFNNRLNNFVVDIGRISLEGLSGEEVQEQLTSVFSKLGDEMALAAIPGLDSYQEVGEGYLETLIRVASTVATVDGIFNQIGQSIGGVGLEGAAAKLKLVDLAGGLQELSNLTQGFYDNFYTETEKTANKTRLVTEEFSRLGVEMIDLKNPDARINFRTLVESLKDTNQEAYVGLLKLQGAVSDLTPEFKAAETAIDLTNQKLSLQDKINQMTMSSSQYLALQRQKELDAMDESLRPLQLRIYALEDEKAALAGLQSAMNKAFSVLEKSVNNQKKVLKKELDDKVGHINDLKKAENDRYDAEKTILQNAQQASSAYYSTLGQSASDQVDAAKTYRDNIKGIFDDINSAIEKLTNSTASLQSQTYASAKAQLDVILSLAQSTGQLPDGDSFKKILDTVSNVNAGDFASMFDFQREQLVTAGKLSTLGGITGGKLSTAEAQLKAAEDNVKWVSDMAKSSSAYYETSLSTLDTNHTETIKLLDDEIEILQKQYEDDVFYLDGLLEKARDQLAVAEGTYIATMSVEAAVSNFGTALGAYVAAKDIEHARLVEQVDSMSKKTTAIDATANKTASDYGVLVEELSQMRADINAGNRAIATNTLASAKVLSQWDGDGQPETRNVA